MLIARTQGNPFFLEESVRTLVETGALVGERGLSPGQISRYLAGPGHGAGAGQVRIDRLPPEDKRLLQTAAVIGTEVPCRCCRPSPTRPMRRCTAVWRSSRRRSFSTKPACFPNVPIRSSTPSPMRWRLGVCCRSGGARCTPVSSRRWRPWWGTGGTTRWERLAQHALRGEVWDKGLTYGRQAGDKAQARSAYREAVTLGEQAFVAHDALPDRHAATEQAIDLRLGLHAALNALGEPPGGCSTICATPRPSPWRSATRYGSDTST